MKAKLFRPNPLVLVTIGILALFALRTLLAVQVNMPRLFDLFNALIVAGSAIILVRHHGELRAGDWAVAAALGLLVGAGMFFATLFTPYPFFGIVRNNAVQAWGRGTITFLACLGGLVVMRRGGPVSLWTARREFGRTGRDVLFGLIVGAPLAVLNVFALKFSEGQSILWQRPAAALLDALQPAIVEEVVFRFALWGLLWTILRTYAPGKAVWFSGVMAMLIHSYAHLDTLLVEAPLTALAMGLVMTIFWGLPLTLLARYRGLESAIAFHWLQDVARFLAGF